MSSHVILHGAAPSHGASNHGIPQRHDRPWSLSPSKVEPRRDTLSRAGPHGLSLTRTGRQGRSAETLQDTSDFMCRLYFWVWSLKPLLHPLQEYSYVVAQRHVGAYVTAQGTAHLILDYPSYSEQVGSTVSLGPHQVAAPELGQLTPAKTLTLPSVSGLPLPSPVTCLGTVQWHRY